MPSIPTKKSNDKTNFNGIEVNNKIVWKSWVPGSEFTKVISLKNVSIKTKKLKFKSPSTRFFTTIYPQDVMLSTGTSFNLPITFRPLENTIYNDAIQFYGEGCQFSVDIIGALAEPELHIIDSIYVGMCAVNDYITAQFSISNTSEASAVYKIECGLPFIIGQSSGIIRAKSTVTHEVTFKPKEAVVYECELHIRYGKECVEDFNATSKLKAIGKYAHLVISNLPPVTFDPRDPDLHNDDDVTSGAGVAASSLCFGAIGVGGSRSLFLEIANLSPVSAAFTIFRQGDDFAGIAATSSASSVNAAPTSDEEKVPVGPELTVDSTSDDSDEDCAGGGATMGGDSSSICVAGVVANVSAISVVDASTTTSSLAATSSTSLVATPPDDKPRPPSVFKYDRRMAVVPANGNTRIQMIYMPSVVDSEDTDYFYIKPIGGASRINIKCTGNSIGPKMSLSTNVVNFNEVHVGCEQTFVVYLSNESPAKAVYQFAIDCDESVFKFEWTHGILEGKDHRELTKQPLKIKFQPKEPINYYRRITCIINNQDALFLDLLGSCHSDDVKPAILKQQHLTNFEVYANRGLSYTPPDQLNELIKLGRLKKDEKGLLYNPETDPNYPLELQTSGNEVYFNDGYHADLVNNSPHVSFDKVYVDFGALDSNRLIQPQDIVLTNHTKGIITVTFMGECTNVFTIVPEICDVNAGCSASFKVHFSPPANNRFYHAELECYATYRCLREYRLVNSDTHFPPWCLTINAIGHTYVGRSTPHCPHLTFDPVDDTVSPAAVTFPPTNVDKSAFCSIAMKNTSDLPVLFKVLPDLENIFSVKPTQGYLEPYGHQIFVIKMTGSSESRCHQHTLTIVANENFLQKLRLCGSVERSEIIFDSYLNGDGTIYFKPTALCGAGISKRPLITRNVSRVPLAYRWRLSQADRKSLTVAPLEGILPANQKMESIFSFRPLTSGHVNVMKPRLVVWDDRSSALGGAQNQERTYLVRAIGEGVNATIKCDNDYINFGPIMVGETYSKDMVLVNEGQSSLHYRLAVSQSIGEQSQPDFQFVKEDMAMTLEWQYGVIAAKSSCPIKCSIHPTRRAYYQWIVYYQILKPDEPEPLPFDPSNPGSDVHFLCHLMAAGMFPSVGVIDARCHGSASGLSKLQLWQLFHLDELNMILDGDPGQWELKSSPSCQIINEEPNVCNEDIVDFNFSSAPVGAEQSFVDILLKNTGSLPCEWSFNFPSDVYEEKEYWADSGHLSTKQLHEMKIQDNHLFTIEPKKGKLNPGETQVVLFSYQHLMAGTDCLSVSLNVNRGRKVLYGAGRVIPINLIGVTIETTRHYIHFHSDKHMFSPMPIGQKSYPVQTYELFNGGALPVKYTLGGLPLEILNKENYDYKIFECLNPTGEVLPGETVRVQWVFSPLEAKIYKVDVPVRIHNADTAVIRFTGIGYDDRAVSERAAMLESVQHTYVPYKQLIRPPAQNVLINQISDGLCYLSEERINLLDVPLYTQSRRVVAITNRSATDTALYKWFITSASDQPFVTVIPNQGSLKPSESISCKMTFTALGRPSFFDIDLICEIMSQSECDDYRDHMLAWEEERDRQNVEFNITETNINDDLRVSQERIKMKGATNSMRRVVDGVGGPTQQFATPPGGGAMSNVRLIRVRQSRMSSPLYADPEEINNNNGDDGEEREEDGEENCGNNNLPQISVMRIRAVSNHGLPKSASSIRRCLTAEILQSREIKPPGQSAGGKSLTFARNDSPDINRYKTLPPIKQMSVDDMRASKNRSEKLLASYWPKAKPPAPFLLHLGVTARTHHLNDYQHTHADLYANFFVDRLLSNDVIDMLDQQTPQDQVEYLECFNEEADSVRVIMIDIIRSLMEDNNFSEACEHVDCEPIPYFQQLCPLTRPISCKTTGDQSRALVAVMEAPPSSCLQSSPAHLPELEPPSDSFAYYAVAGVDGNVPLPIATANNTTTPATPASQLTSNNDIKNSTFADTKLISTFTSSGKCSTGEENEIDEEARIFEKDEDHLERELLKIMPEFGELLESLLEDTLSNVITEAYGGEFQITAKRRLIALPPPSAPATASTIH